MSATSDEADSGPKTARSAGAAPLLRLLIRAVGLAALKREATAAAKNTAIRVALGVAAGLLWLLVLGYLLATFTIWLASLVGAIFACLIVAAIFAVIAIALHLVAAGIKRQRHHFSLKAELPKDMPVDPTTLGALAVAALAGFFVGTRGKR
ncbi:MAG TPA: phage holin family protein [Bauldia sp.]|nr:phage holin family protein [Bauldia sp.]